MNVDSDITVIYETKCPYCGTSNCYNSGFSVECVNRKCQFYNQTHCNHVMSEIRKLKKQIEKEEIETRQTLEDVDIYSSNPVMYSSAYNGFMPYMLPQQKK